MEVPEKEERPQEKKKIQGHFSQEFYLNRDQLATFLRDLANEVENEGEIRINTDEWELPFNSRKNAEVEIELEEDELEIEVEFEKAKNQGKGLSAG